MGAGVAFIAGRWCNYCNTYPSLLIAMANDNIHSPVGTNNVLFYGDVGVGTAILKPATQPLDDTVVSLDDVPSSAACLCMVAVWVHLDHRGSIPVHRMR